MEKIFLSILNMSLTGSFVIAAIMLARLLLKKAPKIISYALWAVAGFRLVFPLTLESVLSLLPFKSAPIPQDIAMQAVPRIDSGITVIDNAVSAALPAATPAASVNPLQAGIAVGSYIWLLGIVAMLIYSFVSIILLKHRLRGASFADGNLYEADNLKTPFVIGLFRPKIYIPAGLTGEERRYIVRHEQTHIRRHDHAVKMFAYLVLCLHWFNPLAWIAFILMGADMEMSCDERVIKELGGDIKNAYSLSLVRVAAGHKILNGSPLAFGEGGMKERIKNVLNFKKPSRVIITLAVALVAVLSVGFAVNKVSDNSIDENKLLTRLGYSKELVFNVIDNKTTFSEDNEHIAQIVKTLPLQADRKYVSFSLEDSQEINIVYGFDYDNSYRGGNGLDPFPETVRENNALLLFAAVEGLAKVNFLHCDDAQTLDHMDSYTIEDLTGRFGEIAPLDMSFVELYNFLAANIQLSEYYFAHYSRIYLGADFEEVSYRNGEPNEVEQQSDGSAIWIYGEFGKSYKLLSSDNWEIDNPGYTAIYYFNNISAEKNDNLTGLYATMLFENDGESFDDLTAYLGYPATSEDMGSGNKYIAYSLREGQQRNAYFILRNNKVIAQGVMYGKDYTTLDFTILSTLRTPYVGDNSAVGKIVDALPRLDGEHTQRFFSIGDDYGTGRAPFTLTVYYEPNDAETSDIRNITVTPENSALFFALIDNLEEVNYAFRATPGDAELDKAAYTSRVTYSREDIAEYLGSIGLGWEDFKNDWNGSAEKMFTLFDENAQPNPIETMPPENSTAIGNNEYGGSDLVNVTFYGIDDFSRGTDIPLTESQQHNIVTLLETVEKIPSDSVRDKDAYPTTVFISLPGEEVIQYCLWSDGMFGMSKDALGKSPELLDYVSDLVLEHTGADLLGYDSNAIYGLTSAELTLTRKSPLKDQPDPPVTQFVTDPSALAQIEKLFQNARPMQGVSACPFDMLLTLTRADGSLFRYVLADDSCAAAITESGVCIEYGVRNSNGNDRSSFEKIFDSIPWR